MKPDSRSFFSGVWLVPVALAVFAGTLTAQSARYTALDSALVRRILLAEDRRDSTDAALVEGVRHPDARIAELARRARWRIGDPVFAARDSLAPLPRPPVRSEPAWRARYRALIGQESGCAVIRAGLSDRVWPVRLRAADLVAPACSGDEEIARTLRRWIDALPRDAARRRPGAVSWHGAAHALLALARLRPAEARPRIARLSAHRQWQVRMYAARAGASLADSAVLRALARDPDDNVKDAAISALDTLTGHSDDALYLAALGAKGAQAVRAAAIALKGSPRADVRAAADAAFARWVARESESERDVRLALLAAAGRPAGDDRAPVERVELAPQAVALALGAERRLRVTMTRSSGGGSFVVRLRGDVAPNMAARVLGLASAGYYDGTSWHRVDHDFVVQGGGHGANEYVGFRRYFRDELGTVPHSRGTIGMSTRGHDTGDAQWFVNLKDNERLGRDFTVFAEVVEGIDIVDAILEGDIIASVRPAR